MKQKNTTSKAIAKKRLKTARAELRAIFKNIKVACTVPVAKVLLSGQLSPFKSYVDTVKTSVHRQTPAECMYSDDNEYRLKILNSETQPDSLARQKKWRKFDKSGVAFDTSRRIEESERQLPADWMPKGGMTISEAFLNAKKLNA